MARLRKVESCGPVGMFNHLAKLKGRKDKESLEKIRSKVKFFFTRYAEQRNKATIVTPSPHLTGECADDNRFDLRPIFYHGDWKH